MDTVIEKKAVKINGFIGLIIVLALLCANILLLKEGIVNDDPSVLYLFLPLLLVFFILLSGFTVIQPNESRVLLFFGKYTGTIKEPGFWFIIPLSERKRVSLRIHNFNSEKIKVNDLHGNPIEIAAVIVWAVTDSAKAVFDVHNYEQFVGIQSETAIRNLATAYAYDLQDEDSASLRGNTQEICEELTRQVQSRLDIAGVKVLEARISYLAYAPEIAQAMLRRQQALAVVAARQKIVEGAVGMVDMALKALSEQHIVSLDEDKKATMVNNLLVALVSEVQAQPVINTGTLYQ